MYALLLILLLLLFYWYSNRAPPPPIYVAPVIPDLTNTINTGPTDMTLVLPVASVDNNVYASSVDNSIVPITPPLGPSVAVPDMTSTDVMNTPTDVSVPIVAGGSVDPAVSPTVAELAGEYVENVDTPHPVTSRICICRKWGTNKNRCMKKPNVSGYIEHITVGGICPDPVCQSKIVIGAHDYVKFFPGVPIPNIVKISPNNVYGLCKCVTYKNLCTKNNDRCILKNSKEPCLWPQCKNQVSTDQLKLESNAKNRNDTYVRLFDDYKKIILLRDGAKNSLDSYILVINPFKESVQEAEVVYTRAKLNTEEALIRKNKSIAANESSMTQEINNTAYKKARDISDSKLLRWSNLKKELGVMEQNLKSLQLSYDKANSDLSVAIDKVKKAETEARNAHTAAYAADTGKGFVAYVISAFSNTLSGFLNYRSGYRRY